MTEELSKTDSSTEVNPTVEVSTGAKAENTPRESEAKILKNITNLGGTDTTNPDNTLASIASTGDPTDKTALESIHPTRESFQKFNSYSIEGNDGTPSRLTERPVLTPAERDLDQQYIRLMREVGMSTRQYSKRLEQILLTEALSAGTTITSGEEQKIITATEPILQEEKVPTPTSSRRPMPGLITMEGKPPAVIGHRIMFEDGTAVDLIPARYQNLVDAVGKAGISNKEIEHIQALNAMAEREYGKDTLQIDLDSTGLPEAEAGNEQMKTLFRTLASLGKNIPEYLMHHPDAGAIELKKKFLTDDVLATLPTDVQLQVEQFCQKAADLRMNVDFFSRKFQDDPKQMTEELLQMETGHLTGAVHVSEFPFGMHLTFDSIEDYSKAMKIYAPSCSVLPEDSGGVAAKGEDRPLSSSFRNYAGYVSIGRSELSSDHLNSTAIHEQRHKLNNIYMPEKSSRYDVADPYISTAKDEVIAFMSGGASKDDLISYLCSTDDPRYSYFKPLIEESVRRGDEDYAAQLRERQAQHIVRVHELIDQALHIKASEGDTALDLLSVTPADYWKLFAPPLNADSK